MSTHHRRQSRLMGHLDSDFHMTNHEDRLVNSFHMTNHEDRLVNSFHGTRYEDHRLTNCRES
jgi:hypothetical protein